MKQTRTPPCVRLFCIVDTLTRASVLPGVDGNSEELPEKSRLYRSRPHRRYVKVEPTDWELKPTQRLIDPDPPTRQHQRALVTEEGCR